MQIIQSIRDKGAAIVIVVISLSLIGFILMDSRSGSANSARSLASGVGTVDGDKIELGNYNTRIQQAEQQQQQQQRTGQSVTGAELNTLRENTWQQMIAEKIFFKEAGKLGISLTAKELSAILLSNDQMNPFLQEQSLRDPSTGQLDQAKASEALKNIKKMKGSERDMVNAQVVDPVRINSLVAKYSGLIAAGSYYAGWMKERDAAMSNQFSTFQYVTVPYSEISDSTIKVSDAEVNAYVEKNKKMFKQEAGRKISYISFSQLPTKADSNVIMNQVMELKPQFAADTNATVFVARNGSAIDYANTFLPKSKIQSSFTDSVLSAPQGQVYGPYVDNGSYVLAKVIGTKELPDSVQARHILIALQDPQTGQPLHDDASAKALADSILTAIKGGASFEALALKYSADGSKAKGGDLGTFGYGQMVPEFNDFTFTKPVGTIDVVQTQFGYHVIEVEKQLNFKPAYKIAYMAREIVPTDQTINSASAEATKASGQKNNTELSKYAVAHGLGITKEPTLIKENSYAVGNMADARQLVKWAFEADKGDVSEPFNIDNAFVVATVDKIEKEGLQDAETARSGAEVIIKNQKKAEIIKTKLGANTTLESAAAAYGKQIAVAGADSTITLNAQMINGIGIEPKLLGAAFNKTYLSKASPAFGGTNGVYVVKVNAVQALAPMPPELAKQKEAVKVNAMKQSTGNWFQSLRDQADVKDKRSKYF